MGLFTTIMSYICFLTMRKRPRSASIQHNTQPSDSASPFPLQPLLSDSTTLCLLQPLPPTLSRLPAEIILLISSLLSLTSATRLSQVCVRLRAILSPSLDGQLQSLTRTSRFHALNEWVESMPDHFVCRKCLLIHSLNDQDLPEYRGSSLNPLYRCNKKGINRGWKFSVGLLNYYSFGQHHVHLALKHNRLMGQHSEYLKEILSPYSDTPDAKHWYFDDFLRHTYSAIPKIIDNRLFLYSRYEFTLKGIRDFDPFCLQGLTICPHLIRSKRNPRSWMNRLLYAIERCKDDFLHRQVDPTQLDGHCEYCPTDFSIQFVSSNTLTISVWQDLGNGKSFADPSWVTMIRWMPRGINHPGPILSRTPGSVEKKYRGLESDWNGVECDPSGIKISANFQVPRSDVPNYWDMYY
jgi:hypothetical protein